jgi:hypothetical protein
MHSHANASEVLNENIIIFLNFRNNPLLIRIIEVE